MVKSGTTFTQAHIMGSLAGAVCAPSRAMLMTGRSVFQVHQDGGLIPAKEKTFRKFLEQTGTTLLEQANGMVISYHIIGHSPMEITFFKVKIPGF
ncbi:hypothetical protein [Pedobacter sp.]|uniref:hypothetical protein n=1 Tax=Pedobacter sp. TaxID=1411316 RepID=UPI003BA8FE40